MQAREMFKDANKVTDHEKKLILAFMAGSRGEANQTKRLSSSLSFRCEVAIRTGC